MAARLRDHIVDGTGDEAVVFLDEAEDETAEVADLLGGVLKRDLRREDLAGDLCEDLDVRVDDGGPQVLRCRDLCYIQLDV